MFVKCNRKKAENVKYLTTVRTEIRSGREGAPHRPDSPAGTPGNLTPVFLRNRVFDHPLPVLHQTELFAGHLFNRGR